MVTRTEESIGNYSFGDWKNQNELRIKFIINVYNIQAFEIFTSTLFCFLSLMYDSIYTFQSNNIWLLVILFALIFILLILPIWYKEAFRDYTISCLIVFLYSIGLGYIISYVCLATNPKLILMVIFMSFAFISALTLFCEITKNELSLTGGIFFCSSISIILFIIFFFISDDKPALILLSSLWVIVYGMYIIYDTLLMLGNKENDLQQSEYILASFSFYTDIFVIFASMFQILSFLKDNKEDEKINQN